MKRVFALTFALALSVPLLSGLALGQDPIFQFSFGGPNTKVRVINDTDDNAPVAVDLGGKFTKYSLLKGAEWEKNYSYGTQASVAITAYVCTAAPTVIQRNPPPVWATDPRVVGGAALPSSYSDPSEKRLNQKVRELKKAIRDRLGHKEMEKELDGWVRLAKKYGLVTEGQRCQNPTILVRNLDVSQWGYSRTATFLVKGSRAKGYNLESQY